jgi:DNA-binding transcriptional LysR family regulator
MLTAAGDVLLSEARTILGALGAAQRHTRRAAADLIRVATSL